jgi:drug/metabolite transporter (DMT)-like permease
VAVLAALMSASAAISIKFLSRTENADAIVIWTTMLWVPLSFLPALWVWQMPVGITWLWIILSGFLGTTAHMCWTRALGLADASMLTPISFFQVLVVGVLGWLLFDETVDRWTVVGAAIIFVSNAYIAQREARTARRAVTDRDINPKRARRQRCHAEITSIRRFESSATLSSRRRARDPVGSQAGNPCA